jgi:hypothetical protein
MRTNLLLTAAVLLAGMAPGGLRAADRAVCEQAFRAYDSAVWLYPDNQFDEERPVMRADVARAAQRLVRGDCLTRSADLDGLPALAARLAPFTMARGGPAIRPATVELGIVTGIWDEGRVTAFFRGLGYRSRGVGAETLGRRLFIGPFTSQAALDQALEVARQAGFIAPHVAERVRF